MVHRKTQTKQCRKRLSWVVKTLWCRVAYKTLSYSFRKNIPANGDIISKIKFWNLGTGIENPATLWHPAQSTHPWNVAWGRQTSKVDRFGKNPRVGKLISQLSLVNLNGAVSGMAPPCRHFETTSHDLYPRWGSCWEGTTERVRSLFMRKFRGLNRNLSLARRHRSVSLKILSLDWHHDGELPEADDKAQRREYDPLWVKNFCGFKRVCLIWLYLSELTRKKGMAS